MIRKCYHVTCKSQCGVDIKFCSPRTLNSARFPPFIVLPVTVWLGCVTANPVTSYEVYHCKVRDGNKFRTCEYSPKLGPGSIANKKTVFMKPTSQKTSFTVGSRKKIKMRRKAGKTPSTYYTRITLLLCDLRANQRGPMILRLSTWWQQRTCRFHLHRGSFCPHKKKKAPSYIKYPGVSGRSII